jgi:hypothetical protein
VAILSVSFGTWIGMAQPDEKKGYYTRERIVFLVLTAVIGIGLVIPFGIGTMMQRPEDREAGRVAGEPVTAGELDAFRPRAELLAAFDEIENGPFGGMRNQWLRFLPWAMRSREREDGAAREDRAWEWLAYRRAAERAGIRIAPQQISDFILAIYGGPPSAFDKDAYVNMIRGGLGYPVELFEQAVGDHLAVSAYFKAIGDGAVVTQQELLDAYREQNREVEIAFLGFPAESFAAAVQPPSRDAVYRAFEANRTRYAIPAKAQVEYLLAEREALKDQAAAPAEEEIVRWYRDRRETDYRRPEAPAPGAEPWRPLEEVREEIVKTLRLNAAGRLAFERMQKALLEDIGGYEERARKDPSASLDLKAAASARGVAHGVSRFFAAAEIDDIEKDLGTFSSQDREAFRRRVFETMKDGDVMPGQNTPVSTSKGYVIYRLVRRKPQRVPEQLTAEVEAAVVRELRRNAMDALARAGAQRVVDLVNAKGLEAAEAESGKKLLRSPRTRSGRSFADPAPPAGADGVLMHPQGGPLIERAFAMHKRNLIGKAELFTAPARGDEGTDAYAVVLLQHHEATMDRFGEEKDLIKMQLLESRPDMTTGEMIPGKRRQLIDAERKKLREGIEKAKSLPQ